MAITQGTRSGGRAKFQNPAEFQTAIQAALKKGGVKEEIFASEVAPVASSETDIVTVTVPLTIPHISVSPASCVRALERVLGFSKSALYLEVAVALAVFASSGTGADRATKRRVMGIYTQAGFDTRIEGDDYKTVNRRINASAALFQKLGKEAIENAVMGLREGKAIDALTHFLGSTYNFSGINAVLEFAGKKVEQTNCPEYRAARARAAANRDDKAASIDIGARMDAQSQARQQVDLDSDGTIVSAGVLSMVVPGDCTPADVRAMATKLNEFADRMEVEANEVREQNMHI